VCNGGFPSQVSNGRLSKWNAKKIDCRISLNPFKQSKASGDHRSNGTADGQKESKEHNESCTEPTTGHRRTGGEKKGKEKNNNSQKKKKKARKKQTRQRDTKTTLRNNEKWQGSCFESRLFSFSLFFVCLTILTLVVLAFQKAFL
jgi:hypothetical protein